mgnify:CR=1 FL=1
MDKYNIYQQIAERTQGDIYIGVVGPVRTGKSTFIKRFMDLLVIPNIDNPYNRERARDELPQSAAGKTIMTTEPKFVPNEAVEIVLDDNIKLNVRLVDCVGYLVKGALGHLENSMPRMVNTPWFENQIPFEQAAELGTKKVINDHSTIGLVITTDGTITEIPREDYIEAEKRVINELKQVNKPFVIVLNSIMPASPQTLALRQELENTYQVPVIALNCAQMRIDDINEVMEKILLEFPVKEIGIQVPKWIETLDEDHWLKVDIIKAIREVFADVNKIREAKAAFSAFEDYDFASKTSIDEINMGDGSILIELRTPENLFYRILSEATGIEIDGEHKLIGLMKDLSRIKKEYDRIEYALHEVKMKGYGIVVPKPDEITLDEPEIIRQGNKFGVKLRASAPSIHMIRVDIETEVSPLVGTERQSEEWANSLTREFEEQPEKIWQANIFGKSLYELVSEGLYNKLNKMPEDSQLKLQEALQRIMNEGSGGLICIIL